MMCPHCYDEDDKEVDMILKEYENEYIGEKTYHNGELYEYSYKVWECPVCGYEEEYTEEPFDIDNY